jgi:uncharacterized protein YceH (UPF0502 family)
MAMRLTQEEARVLGCLMEKSVVTPDHYPLTLNALANACNQKSSREPVMSLDPGDVTHTIRALQDKRLISVDTNFRNQTEKFAHRFCNTPFSDYQFDSAQFAIICVLLLRGARTPGELRSNSGRLHEFADNEAVVSSLQSLMDLEGCVPVAMLPRTPGRKDAEYRHLFFDQEIPLIAPPPPPSSDTRPDASSQSAEESPSSVELRLAELELEVAELKQRVSTLIAENDDKTSAANVEKFQR